MPSAAIMGQASALDELLEELLRIEGQQGRLHSALSKKQAIVVHPRREVRAPRRCSPGCPPPRVPARGCRARAARPGAAARGRPEEPQGTEAARRVGRAHGLRRGSGAAPA